jgi:chondroitin 4-sulfotransferase 11
MKNKKFKKPLTKLYEYSGAALFLERRRQAKHRNSVFIWIPKTAGTSVYEMLGSPPLLKSAHLIRTRFANKDLVSFGHVDYAQLVREGYVSEEFDSSAYKFAFSRNPYDRAVSLYFYLQQVGRLSAEVRFLGFVRQLSEQPCKAIGLYNSIDFSVCNPQSTWLDGVNPDFVGRVESLQGDIAVVLDALGIQNAESVPQLNTTSHRQYQDYYCPESRDIVEHLYDVDFVGFGYAKGLGPVSDGN